MIKRLIRWPTEKAILVACVVGLLALGLMALSIVAPQPLPVVGAMSVAQGLGGLALLLFAVSVAAESIRGRKGPKSP